MPATQNYANHGRMDPMFHYFLVPSALANVILSIYITIRDWPIHSRSHLWWIFMAIVFFFAVGLTRHYGAKNQDRIIRLEERVRYAAVLSAADLAASHALTLRQIISLRFASDAELPVLMKRTLAEGLTPKQIKQSIVSWRADEERI